MAPGDTGFNLNVERLRSLPVHDDDEVWEVAIVTLPEFIQEPEDPEPWLPLVAVCASNRGGVVMTPATRIEDLPTSSGVDVITSFALNEHVPGVPVLGYLPKRLHVAELPEAVHAHLVSAADDLGIAVEFEPVLPNIDQFLDFVQQSETTEFAPVHAPPLYRVKGMTTERVRSFAEAAAAFWVAAPWQHFEEEVPWIIEPQPRTQALRVCLVIGQAGEQPGLAFLPSMAALEEMLAGRAERPPGTIWSIGYARIEDGPAGDVALWLDESLPLADPEALPAPIGYLESGRVKRPSPTQLNLMEALLRGFASTGPEIALRSMLEFDVVTSNGPTKLVLRRGAL